MADFPERLRAEIKSKGTTNRDLAERVGVRRQTVSEWLAGNNDPSGPNLAALADYFGCTMDYLWGRSDVRVGQDERVVAEILRRVDVDVIRQAVDTSVRAVMEQAIESLARQEGGGEVAGRSPRGASTSETRKAVGLLEDVADAQAGPQPRTTRTRGGRDS